MNAKSPSTSKHTPTRPSSIRKAKKQTSARPRLTCQGPGTWVGNFAASGVWTGSKRSVMGHCMSWAVKFGGNNV